MYNYSHAVFKCRILNSAPCMQTISNVDMLYMLICELLPTYRCSSYIGHVGGNQGVSIGRSCFALHTALHEIGHAIGFFHEQSRPDRDDYVDINYDNIVPGAASQFRKLTEDDVDSLGVGYDYNSIMHYDRNLFAYSREQSTIVAKDPSIPVGGGRALSELDVIQTRRLYECPDNQGIYAYYNSVSIVLFIRCL